MSVGTGVSVGVGGISVAVGVKVRLGVSDGSKATAVGVEDGLRVGATVGVTGIPGARLQASVARIRKPNAR